MATEGTRWYTRSTFSSFQSYWQADGIDLSWSRW